MKFKIPDTPEELFKQGGEKLFKLDKFFPYIVFFGIIGFGILTSFYSVGPDEVGVIQRFGKYNRTTKPGLHLKLPLNMEKLSKVKVTKVYTQEFGFRALKSGVNTQYSSQSYEDESLMLTGDLNVLDVTWIVKFKVKDPVKVLFNIYEPIGTVRDLSESVVRQAVGDSSVTEALTTRRVEINLAARDNLQIILDSYDSGIQIDEVILQDVNPPDKVKASFNEVNEAKQEREKVINQALEMYNKQIPRAIGEAEKTIREAEGYALERVKEAEGDATKFLKIWNAYKGAKEVTLRRLYLESMEEVLPKAGKIFVSSDQTNSILPLLNLNKEMQ